MSIRTWSFGLLIPKCELVKYRGEHASLWGKWESNVIDHRLLAFYLITDSSFPTSPDTRLSLTLEGLE